MPCKLANFILVNWEPEGGSRGEHKRRKEERERERKKGVKSDNQSR